MSVENNDNYSSAKTNFIEVLPKDIKSRKDRGHLEHEKSKGIVCNYKSFFITIKNEADEVVGVLEAYTAFSEIYVDDLWVEARYRGRGYGTKLIRALEKRFQGQGYNNINLVTSQFSAPDFYKKCGFNVEFVRENKHNPQLTKTFFIKYFDDEVQTQGILGRSNTASSEGFSEEGICNHS